MKTNLIVLFFVMLFSSCQKENIAPTGEKNIYLDPKSAQIVENDNEFGLEAFQKINTVSDENNLMISPLSISVALAMAYNGADGDTKTEMEETLKLKGLSTEQINTSYKNLIDALKSVDEKVVFEIANAIFYEKSFTVKPDFLSTNQSVYDAEISPIDFSLPSAVETINNWVADKTHDKIQSIIDNLSPNDVMVLLNAIYFNGTWAKEFDEEGTKMLNFTTAENEVIEVATMSKEDTLDYFKNNLFSAVRMPYGNGQYNMLVFNPENGNTSENIIKALSASNWKGWMNDFNKTPNVVIQMPRFKFAFEVGLNDILKEMGMQKAFQPNIANFSKISDIDLYISSVKHKSFIDVNETGTEAAAVTSVTFTVTSAGPGTGIQKTYFIVDKPFVFAITEKDTGAILFIGKVGHPEYEE